MRVSQNADLRKFEGTWGLHIHFGGESWISQYLHGLKIPPGRLSEFIPQMSHEPDDVPSPPPDRGPKMISLVGSLAILPMHHPNAPEEKALLVVTRPNIMAVTTFWRLTIGECREDSGAGSVTFFRCHALHELLVEKQAPEGFSKQGALTKGPLQGFWRGSFENPHRCEEEYRVLKSHGFGDMLSALALTCLRFLIHHEYQHVTSSTQRTWNTAARPSYDFQFQWMSPKARIEESPNQ